MARGGYRRRQESGYISRVHVVRKLGAFSLSSFGPPGRFLSRCSQINFRVVERGLLGTSAIQMPRAMGRSLLQG